ncbi:MAG: hypothetical protein JWQ22_235 [Devosia sp.]|nr:hypothetical protein [Devosia sp.]
MTDNHKRLGFFTRLLDDVGPADRYRLAAEQIIKAEEQGFDSAWVAQHHFSHDEGGLPSPFVFLSHVAARTQSIRLGTGIVTLPLEAPLRVAEDAVVFDLLSGSRLELGVGSGGTPSSFTAFGLDSSQRGPIHGANLATVKAALAGNDVGGGNQLYPEGKSLLNRIWQATFSVEGGQRAGAAGDGLMLSRTQPRSKDNPLATLAELQNPIIDAYLAALPAGIEPRILASRTLFVADDRATALEWADIGLRRVASKFAASGHVLTGDRLEDLIRNLDTHVGDAQDVTASLAEDSTLGRVSDISFQVHSVDPPHALILRSLELIASEVAPALGWRDKPTTPRIAIAR